MNTKARRFSVVATTMALVALLTWVLWPLKDAEPVAASSKPISVPVVVLTKPVQSSVVEAPKAAPALAADASKQTDEAKHADINFAITHLINLLENKDYENAVREYTPPYELNLMPTYTFDGMVHFLQTNPYAPEKMASLINALHSIQGQTPTMDEQGDPIMDDTLTKTLGHTGEKAIYNSSTSTGDKTRIIFVNQDGVWYLRGFLPPYESNGLFTP